MVEGSLVGRWKAMRWSTTKLQSKADLAFFTLRREGGWPKLKVLEVMEPLYVLPRGMDKDGTAPSNLVELKVLEPLYVLPRGMDKDGTAPSNLVECDRLMERTLGEVVLTEEQRGTVLEKLLRSGKNLKDHGYIDLWTQFFESLPQPKVDDGSILKDPMEEKYITEEELVQERAFIKTPKGRISKSLEDEEEESTDDNDLDDDVRMREEEEERRAAIPTRKEWEKLKKKVGERESESVGDMGRLEEEKEEAMDQREEEAEHEIGQPAQEEEKMEQEEKEEEASMEQREEEMEQEEEEGIEQQEEELEESEKEQQQEKMENNEEQQQQHAPKTVYTRRKQTVEAAGLPKNSPDLKRLPSQQS
ncbi:hypothetical protein CBR_g21833 [Chara braunii]|uniref:Uncharacterized protein n=1 Tax=Chara braunii TaxID=69332 RepID=A0A388JUN5_CHABU|nr:hypothetical protein CBR_g21833 [Chara braunii]|eukprot:GBG61490.1 hypothetical protein CBR_g21833 [Chara braunii]